MFLELVFHPTTDYILYSEFQRLIITGNFSGKLKIEPVASMRKKTANNSLNELEYRIFLKDFFLTSSKHKCM